MPRVMQHKQYRRHLFLRTVWINPSHQDYLAVLSTNEQWKLHAFYRPAEELTFKHFRDHLRAMRQGQPQPCHVSGKLYRRVEVAFIQQHKQSTNQTPKRARSKVPARRRGGRVVVYGIVRPKPDLNKLLKAMILMAREGRANDDESKT